MKMNKKLLAILLSTFMVLPLSSFEWGGVEKLGLGVNTSDFSEYSPNLSSSTYLWLSTPFGESGLKFMAEGVFKCSFDLASLSLSNNMIADVDLFKLDYAKDALSLSFGRFYNNDITYNVLSQNLDGAKLTYTSSIFEIGAYCGYTGLLNGLNTYMLSLYGSELSYDANYYALAYPYVILGANFKLPYLPLNQALALETLACFDVKTQNSNRYYLNTKLYGPLGSKCFYDLSCVLGAINFKDFMASVGTTLNYYINDAFALNFALSYSSSNYAGITSTPLFNNVAGLEARSSAGFKTGATYQLNSLLLAANVSALCSIPETGFSYAGTQLDLSLIYNIFYDFQLSYGAYAYIDAKDSSSNNKYGMNLNLSLAF